MNKNIKSKAKAAGVKSTFKYDDHILMTSFGKGSQAIREKLIVDGHVENLNKKNVYGVQVNDDVIEVESSIVSGVEINIASIDREDSIGAKAELEKKYFGENACFSDENIRI